jgi:hypothetical protein
MVVERPVVQARALVRIETGTFRLRSVDMPWLVGNPSRSEHDTAWRIGFSLERTLTEDWRERK